jgi:DNA-binding HxlR family transcriptional regulator
MTRDEREFIFDPSSEAEDSAVSEVIELTSRKWTRSIIEHLLADGSLRYNELREAIDGISDKVLSDSLEALEEHYLVDREVIDDRPVKVEYSLTEAGAALEPVIDAVSDWLDLYLEQVGERE